MELSSQSGSSNAAADENLTKSHPSTPSKRSPPSNLSNNNTDDADNQESDSDDLSRDKQLKSQLIVTIPGSSRLPEGSAGEGGGSCPPCNICAPTRYVQVVLPWFKQMFFEKMALLH